MFTRNSVLGRGMVAFSLLFMALLTSPMAPAAVWHVSAASTAEHPDGQSWATAYPVLQPAVDAATSGDEVWVAKGTYTGTGEQVVKLKADITLYGGFAGAETERAQRDWKTNVTVIDGQEARQCVLAAESATVNGFTMQNGYAQYGAGMEGGTAENCTFTGGLATLKNGQGGGMYQGTAVHCLFTGNEATYGGGISRGNAVNSTFAGNNATSGGAMYMGAATNCIFGLNRSIWGGAMNQSAAVNCTFAKNVVHDARSCESLYDPNCNCYVIGGCTDYLGAGAALYSGTATNCILWSNGPKELTADVVVTYSCTSSPVSGAGNISADPLFVDAAAGDFRLQAGSPCIDAGTPEGAPATDILGAARPQGAEMDMGAYEMSFVPVPGLYGMALMQASEILAATQLYMGAVSEGYDYNLPPGSVMDQSPADGTHVLPWTKVDLVISIGPQPVPVPDVVGQTEDAATSAIMDAGFAIGAVTRSYNPTVPSGVVITQTPAAKTELTPGSPVDLVISRGPKPVPTLRYVNAASTAQNPDGKTWETAYPSLQPALSDSVEGDELWVAAGSYVGVGDEVAKLKDAMRIYGGFSGGENGLDQRDWKKNPTIIDGDGMRRCVTAAEDCIVDGFTLTNGRVKYAGGGMYFGTAVNCVFTANSTTLEGHGGAMNGGTAVDCLFTGNSSSGEYGVGGAVAFCTAIRCVFRENAADSAGGAMWDGAATDCVFRDNVVTGTAGDGGAICFGTAVNCSFFNNAATDYWGVGGAAWMAAATNCLFVGNSAGWSCGGLASGSATNCTFTGNTAPLHGGLSGGTVTNCIVWGNSNDEPDPYTVVSFSCMSTVVAGEGNITGDPLFVDAPAGDFRLQPGSPCLNAGRADGAPSTDILGVARPQGAGVDMGAYEAVLVTVPNLSGLDRAVARDLVAAAKLHVCVEREEYHSTIAIDHVINQYPAAEVEVVQGTPVDLTISKGPEPVPVPEVAGLTQEAATAAITGAGLRVGTVTQAYSLTVPAGSVISQSIAAGTPVLPGAVINLVVSGGVQPSVMPDTSGMTRAQAAAAVTGAGLLLGLVTQARSDTVTAGSVISQSPAAGTEVPPGAVVSILVSLGPAPVPEGEPAANEGEPVAVTAQQLAEALETADSDGDGALSFDEAVAALPELTQTQYDTLDADGDGALTQDELDAEECSGCAGFRVYFGSPFSGGGLADLFLMALGALGLAAMSTLRR